MDILGQVKKAWDSLADSAMQQADFVQLQTRLANLEAERERQLVEAGKRARERWLARKIADRELDTLMRRITDIDRQLEDLREEITRHGQEAESSSS